MVASSNSSENDAGGFSHLPAATANSIPPGDQFIRLSGWRKMLIDRCSEPFQKTYFTLKCIITCSLQAMIHSKTCGNHHRPRGLKPLRIPMIVLKPDYITIWITVVYYRCLNESLELLELLMQAPTFFGPIKSSYYSTINTSSIVAVECRPQRCWTVSSRWGATAQS